MRACIVLVASALGGCSSWQLYDPASPSLASRGALPDVLVVTSSAAFELGNMTIDGGTIRGDVIHAWHVPPRRIPEDLADLSPDEVARILDWESYVSAPRVELAEDQVKSMRAWTGSLRRSARTAFIAIPFGILALLEIARATSGGGGG